MNLSEMRDVLARRDIQLTKSLGQNFLHDANQLRRIVDAAELTKADKVLEVGPGLGPLTELLLESAGEVLAVEMDGRLVEVLRERFPALQLLHADALKFLQQEKRDWSGWKLVSNLPYSVASPILVELAQNPRLYAAFQTFPPAVELHWRLAPDRAPENDVWQRAAPMRHAFFSGRPWVPRHADPEDRPPRCRRG